VIVKTVEHIPRLHEVAGSILIDGAYIESEASGAGLWTGSGNQRVIDLQATRRGIDSLRLNICLRGSRFLAAELLIS
jgi:hypothetical protein